LRPLRAGGACCAGGPGSARRALRSDQAGEPLRFGADKAFGHGHGIGRGAGDADVGLDDLRSAVIELGADGLLHQGERDGHAGTSVMRE